MALTKKQSEMDVDKWLKSEQAGRDMCGEFEFCASCDKEVENPCAKALSAYNKQNKTENSDKPVAKKSTARKSCGKKSDKKA